MSKFHIAARCAFRLALILAAMRVGALQAGNIYWTDSVTQTIHRADLDGANVKSLVLTGLSNAVRGLTLDLVNDKMYWGDYGTNRIQRANLDGSHIETIVTLTNGVRGVAVDPAGGKLYWTDRDAGSVYRSNLNGTNIQPLATGQSYPYTIRVDPAGGKIYWEDRGTLNIRRANLDGSGIQNIVKVSASPFSTQTSLDIDLVHQHLYMGDGGVNEELLIRTDLSGKNRTTILSNIVEIRGLILDVPADTMYFASRLGDNDVIWRAKLDGSDVTQLLTLPLYSVRSIAIDPRVVPEPTTLAMLSPAAAVIVWTALRHRRRR